MSDSFLVLAVLTAILRGLGAGFILGAELMMLPVRRRLDPVAYAGFMRAAYHQPGVQIYAATTIVGAVLLVTLTLWSFASARDPLVSWFLLAASAATVVGFVGTAGAFPAMRRLRATPDHDTRAVASFLDSFARWSALSAIGHVSAFIALAMAFIWL